MRRGECEKMGFKKVFRGRSKEGIKTLNTLNLGSLFLSFRSLHQISVANISN